MDVLAALNVDALVVSGGTNRRYLSGWSAEDHAPDRPVGVMLITPAGRTLYASPTNLPWARAEVHGDVVCRELSGSWTGAISTSIREQMLTRIGFEDALLPVANYWQLHNDLGDDVSLVPLGDRLDALRSVKTVRELGLIQQALNLTDQAFERASNYLREGMSELELARYIDQQFRELGSDGQAFDTIVASGPNASRPHHSPGERRIQAGEPVIIDMGGRVDGYCGDLTRTIWAGKPSERLLAMYQLVAEAQQAAFDSVKDGISAVSVDRSARDVFADAGLEEHFVHGVGHAIGLRIHESPFLGARSEDVLETGNVITIEPGLYFPEWGGVRIEDVVVVEDDGYVNLTHAPKLDEVSR
jgi:Xaa-Pro aminopeptidase